jgi:hypothetical protein
VPSSDRPLRILFFCYHPGYLRHYREPVRLLARDGHVVHLAFTILEKDAGDAALATSLAAEHPNVTYGKAPTRGYLDGWRRTSLLVRAFTDLARYIDPRYEDAPALRGRMAAKIRSLVVMGKADPVTSSTVVRLIDRLAHATDARLGRRLLRLLAAAERAIPTSRRIDRFVAGFAPDLVLATPLVEFASSQVDYLKSARKLGITTGACIASWDNLTNKGLLRFVPDGALVWNEHQRDELAELHGVPRERAFVTGAQKFDAWFERRPSRTPRQLRKAAGLDPSSPHVLYVCSSPFIAPDEVSFVRRWIDALRGSEHDGVRKLGVLVRPHPQNYAQWQGVDLSDQGNAVVWPPAGAQPDHEASRADFYDSIVHASAVVGVNTSAMIDAAIVGKNVFTVLDPAFAAPQEGTLHFRYLLRDHGGFLNVAQTLAEHDAQLAAAIAGGEQEAARVREFVRTFVRPRGLDVPVAPVVAEAIAELARRRAGAPTREPLSTYALRALLLAPTALATATLFAGWVAQALRGGETVRGHARRGRAETAEVIAPPP